MPRPSIRWIPRDCGLTTKRGVTDVPGPDKQINKTTQAAPVDSGVQRMTEAEFRAKRRQNFLTEKYFRLNDAALQFFSAETRKSIPERKAAGDLDPFGEGGLLKDSLRRFRLHYTAGESVDALKPLFTQTMQYFGEWHRAYGLQIQALAMQSGDDLRIDGTPLPFDDLFHFQIAIDLVSIGILLGDGNAVRTVAAWLERHRGTDMLFESLIEPAVADPRTDVEEFFHSAPYDPLLDAIFTAETTEQASACVKTYLEGWYQAFEGAPRHNGHLVVTDEYSNYEGYWSFEAAAVCVLHDIDDSSFREHLVYPKDLADWARLHDVTGSIQSKPNAQPLRLRCEAGQPCPYSGYWSTTARAGSRRAFVQGETMPQITASDWGMTIWYWDQQP